MTQGPENDENVSLGSMETTEPTFILTRETAQEDYDVLEAPTLPSHGAGEDGEVAAEAATPEPERDRIKKRMVRLPTESEIRAAIEATPTDELPAVRRPR